MLTDSFSCFYADLTEDDKINGMESVVHSKLANSKFICPSALSVESMP